LADRNKSPDLGAQVSDPNSGVLPFFSVGRWISVRSVLAVLAFVGVAIGGVFLVRHLARVSGDGGSQPAIDLSWTSNIENLGVAPVFPPEEDLVVGDVLAVIVRDADIDSHDPGNPVAQRALITRAVKLAHVDAVGEMLKKAYALLPVFPDKAAPPKLRDSVARDFSDAVLLENLPRAAFPKLKIKGISSAGAGIGADGRASASYAAASQQVEEFELSEVRTYGLPAVAAQQAFDQYCKEDAPEVCEEATARKHLERVIGSRIYDKVQNEKSGDYEFAVTIEILMVCRVYLTSSIRDLRAASQSQGGSWFGSWAARAAPPAAPSEPPAAAPAAAPAAVTGDLAGQIAALNTRVAELQHSFDRMKNGAAVQYQSSSGNEASLEGRFIRPVAVGYRSVKHDIPAPKPSNP
jgi:hypothetical protein